MSALLAGATLADRYTVLDQLGAGGMGTVYRAYDRELDEVVALKMLHVDLAAQPTMAARFRHEVKLARRVTHGNVARTFELGTADGILFCTMELVTGESLRDRLRRCGKLSIAEATAIAADTCAGLAAAHAVDVIHRDIKPDNILIAGGGRVVLADFGIAAVTIEDGGGERSGTPAYMAPEQARGEPSTPATDIYALGVVLYEMLTGTRAFSGNTTALDAAKESAGPLRPGSDIPAELAQVVARATSPELANRITSADELGRMLAPWTGERPAKVAPSPRGTDDGQLHSVVVFAPRCAHDAPLAHLADGVHSELLRLLVHVPRVRVLPRVEGDVPGATTVELRVSDVLEVTIRGGEDAGASRTTSLRLPLTIDDVTLAAAATTAAIADVIARRRDTAASAEALELLLRARVTGQGALGGVATAFQLLERAHALAPADPRIAAGLAMVHLRTSHLDSDARVRGPRTLALVRAALAAGPELAEPHVAAGYFELYNGDSALAAGHFRRAIACSPHVAEAHEGLGRMLLEAGFLDAAFARLDDALALAPHLSSVHWDIARAWALEGRFAEHDRLVAELERTSDRIFVRQRFAWWRRDRAAVAAIQAHRPDAGRAFDAELGGHIAASIIDDAWPDHRDALLAALSKSVRNRRGRALLGQLVAETAGVAGDVATCNAMIEAAVDHGLFDLHWLEKCPVLDGVRLTRDYARSRARVKRRADAILDALYGDHATNVVSETVVL